MQRRMRWRSASWRIGRQAPRMREAARPTAATAALQSAASAQVRRALCRTTPQAQHLPVAQRNRDRVRPAQLVAPAATFARQLQTSRRSRAYSYVQPLHLFGLFLLLFNVELLEFEQSNQCARYDATRSGLACDSPRRCRSPPPHLPFPIAG